MLRSSSFVEFASVLHGTCLKCVEFFFIHQYVQPCLSKNPKYTFYTIVYWRIKKISTLCKHVPCNTLTHSTTEDLLNIKRKGDPEVSYVRYHWNPEPVWKKYTGQCILFYDLFLLFNCKFNEAQRAKSSTAGNQLQLKIWRNNYKAQDTNTT
jgi:hypothetical protein